MLSRTMSSNFYAEEIYLVQQKIKRQEVHNDLCYKRLYHILNNNEVPIDPHFSSISLIFIFTTTTSKKTMGIYNKQY